MQIPDRRKLGRLQLQVPVRIQTSGAAWVDFAETRNVSARGIYFQTEARLNPGEELECVLVLPQRLTQAAAEVLVGCRGRVLRVSNDLPGEVLGVAVEIHSYDFSWHDSLADTLKSA